MAYGLSTNECYTMPVSSPLLRMGADYGFTKELPFRGPSTHSITMTCLWITSAFKTSPIGAAETLAGMPLIHLHVKKLVERSHVCICMLQASHAFHRLVDRDHKLTIKALKGQIHGDLKSRSLVKPRLLLTGP
jgi:hypothetical protein